MAPGPSTRSVHLLAETDSATRAVVSPIVANAAFAYDSVDDWRRVARLIRSSGGCPEKKPKKGEKEGELHRVSEKFLGGQPRTGSREYSMHK